MDFVKGLRNKIGISALVLFTGCSISIDREPIPTEVYKNIIESYDIYEERPIGFLRIKFGFKKKNNQIYNSDKLNEYFNY